MLENELDIVAELLGDTPYVIAGGYARDTFFGVTPKDVDVFIHDKFRNQVLVDVIRSGAAYKDHNKWYANNTKNSDHITSVINVGKIDYIFVPATIDILDITDHFDFNLNQFMLDEDEEPFYNGDGGTPEVLVQLHPDVPDHRIIKIYKKHQELIANGKI